MYVIMLFCWRTINEIVLEQRAGISCCLKIGIKFNWPTTMASGEYSERKLRVFSATQAFQGRAKGTITNVDKVRTGQEPLQRDSDRENGTPSRIVSDRLPRILVSECSPITCCRCGRKKHLQRHCSLQGNYLRSACTKFTERTGGLPTLKIHTLEKQYNYHWLGFRKL